MFIQRLFKNPETVAGMLSAAIPAIGTMLGLSIFFLRDSTSGPLIDAIQQFAGIAPGGVDGATGGILYSLGGIVLSGCGAIAAALGGTAVYNTINNFPSKLERKIGKELGPGWDVSVGPKKSNIIHATQSVSKTAALNIDYDADHDVASGYMTHEVQSGSTNMFIDGINYPVPTYATIVSKNFDEESLPSEGKNALEIIRTTLPRHIANSGSASTPNNS